MPRRMRRTDANNSNQDQQQQNEQNSASTTTVNSISYPPRGPIQQLHDQQQTPRSRERRDLFSGCRRGWYWESRERNLFSAMLCLLCVTLIGASLADQRWFYLSGGNCPLHSLGVSLFYRLGRFKQIHSADPVYKNGEVTEEFHDHIIYSDRRHRLVDCVTPGMLDLFHGVMGTCFVALTTSLVAFSLDIVGPKKGFLRWLKRNAVFSIFTVILCLLVISLCYWLSNRLDELQRKTSSQPDRVRVGYSEGFYMIVAAAVLSIGAVASSLFRLSRQIKEEEDRVALLENMVSNTIESLDATLSRERSVSDLSNERELPPGSAGPPPPLGMILNVPPPPPYAP